MAITHVQSFTAAGTSVALSNIQPGDLLIVAAYRDGNATPAALQAGWTNIANGGANSNGLRVAWKRAVGGETTSGVWTNSTEVGVSVYRSSVAGALAEVGAAGTQAGAQSTTATVPAATLQFATSWVWGCIGHRTDTGLGTAPTGLTTRSSITGLGLYDTNASNNSTSFTAKTKTVSNSGWRGQSVEIKETLDTTAPTITSANSANLLGNNSATLKHFLTANESVAWSKTGGANQADFTLTEASKFDSANKSTSITLSRNDTRATSTGTGQARTTRGLTSGKWALQFRVINRGANSYTSYFGIVNGSFVFNTSSFLSDANAIAVQAEGDVWVDSVYAGVSIGSSAGAAINGDRVDVLIDMDNKKIAFRFNKEGGVLGTWNANAADDPAVGAFTIPSGWTTVYPAIGFEGSGVVAETLFENFTNFTPPAGYQTLGATLDLPAQTYNATTNYQKVVQVTATDLASNASNQTITVAITDPNAVNWSTSDKTSGFLLSNNNYSAENNLALNEDRAVMGRSNVALPSSGKIYFRAQINGQYTDVGIATTSQVLGQDYSATFHNDTIFWSYGGEGVAKGNGTGAAYYADSPTGAAPGDLVDFAFDMTARKGWIGKNGAYFNTQNPATGTDGFDITAAVTYYIWAHIVNSSNAPTVRAKLTLRTADDGSGTLPSGFSWLADALSGPQARNAVAAQTMPAFTQAATGTVRVDGSASQTLAFTQSATGATRVAAAASQTVPNTTQIATGQVLWAVREYSASQTLVFTQTATAIVVRTASASQNVPNTTQVATGTTPASLTATQNVPVVTQSATGTTRVAAAASQTLNVITQAAAATTIPAASASQTLGAISQTAAGVTIPAAVAAQSLAISQAAAGTVRVEGSASQAFDITQTGTFESEAFPAREFAAAQTLDFTQIATGVTRPAASAAQTLGAITQAATVGAVTGASAAQALAAISQAATGGPRVAGVASQSFVISQVATLEVVALGVSEFLASQTFAVAQEATGTTPASLAASQSFTITQTATAERGAMPGEFSASQQIAISQSATGTVRVVGVASQTVPAITQAATVVAMRSASASQNIAITQAAAGKALVTGDASQAIVVTQVATFNVTDAATNYGATQVLGDITQVATGGPRVRATSVQILPTLDSVAVGDVSVAVTSDQTSVIPQSATSDVIVEGDAAQAFVVAQDARISSMTGKSPDPRNVIVGGGSKRNARIVGSPRRNERIIGSERRGTLL